MSEKGLRVLVIDDEPQIRKLLKVSLGAHGYDVHEAVTGTDAVTQAAVMPSSSASQWKICRIPKTCQSTALLAHRQPCLPCATMFARLRR